MFHTRTCKYSKLAYFIFHVRTCIYNNLAYCKFNVRTSIYNNLAYFIVFVRKNIYNSLVQFLSYVRTSIDNLAYIMFYVRTGINNLAYIMYRQQLSYFIFYAHTSLYHDVWRTKCSTFVLPHVHPPTYRAHYEILYVTLPSCIYLARRYFYWDIFNSPHLNNNIRRISDQFVVA